MNSLGAIANKTITGIKPAKMPAEKQSNSFSRNENDRLRNSNTPIANGIANRTKCNLNPMAIPMNRPLKKALRNDFFASRMEVNKRNASMESNNGIS